jgi:hypothetical protein
MSINDNGLTKLTHATRYPGDTQLFNASNNMVAEYWYDTGNNTNVTSGMYCWRQFSPKSTADTGTTGKYEEYSLPVVTKGLSENKTGYKILTTKNTVTAAQGGTGQSTYAVGDMLYCGTANTLSKLTGNTTATPKFLKMTGTGSAAAAPVWDTVSNIVSVVASASSWSNPSPPTLSTQTISVTGVTATNNIVVGMNSSATAE